jgi:hypothetical protein
MNINIWTLTEEKENNWTKPVSEIETRRDIESWSFKKLWRG